MITRPFTALILGLGITLLNAVPALAAYHHRVPYGTPVQMRLDQPLSSRDMHEGDYVAMRCVYNVVVDGYIVIAAGAPGVAEVISDDGAVQGGLKGQISLKAVWVRAVDHSRIGITGYVSGIGRPRDISNAGVGLQSGAIVAGDLGAYGPSVALGSAGVVADGIASAQKGGEATLDERVRMSTEVANLWGVEIDSDIYAGGTDDSPIK